MVSAFNAQSDPGVVFKSFSASQQSMRSISQQRCKHQYCCAWDCILQILFSSYQISLSFNQSVVAKIKKHFNQFTMSLLFCVILFYIIFLVSAAALRSTMVGSEPTSTGRCETVGTEQMFTGHLVPLYLPLSEFVNTEGTI